VSVRDGKIVNIEGDPIPPPGQETECNIRTVSESYFQTLGVPIVAGRMFDERDKADGTPVVTRTMPFWSAIFPPWKTARVLETSMREISA
jgi:hypothetical protein